MGTVTIICLSICILFKTACEYDLKRRKMDEENGRDPYSYLRQIEKRNHEIKMARIKAGETREIEPERPHDSASDDPENWKKY